MKKALPFLLMLLPNLVFAATTIADIIVKLKGYLNGIIPVVIGLGVLYFIWGMAQFILNSGNEQGVTEGRSKMVWGIIAIFVMIAVWGLVSLISKSLLIDTGGTVTPPQL